MYMPAGRADPSVFLISSCASAFRSSILMTVCPSCQQNSSSSLCEALFNCNALEAILASLCTRAYPFYTATGAYPQHWRALFTPFPLINPPPLTMLFAKSVILPSLGEVQQQPLTIKPSTLHRHPFTDSPSQTTLQLTLHR